MEDPMTAPAPDSTRNDGAVLRLLVRNHPGVMSHITGLFARRAFNVDGIVCVPIADATQSAVLLLVREDQQLDQLVRQLGKLEDVVTIERDGAGLAVFDAVRVCVQ